MILQWVFWSVLLLIVYTYVVYPLFAMVVGPSVTASVEADLPQISFLVPAHNEATVIVRKIENFNQIDYPPDRIELVIADDGSCDGTADLVRPYLDTRIRLLSSVDRRGKAYSMNRLVSDARYPYLFMSDANVMLSPTVVKQMMRHFHDPRVGAVTGEVRLVGSDQDFSAGESLYYLLERRIQTAESRVGSVMGVDGGMYALRKELFRELPEDTILDDFTVSMHVLRAGKRIVYDGMAKAIESGTPTTRQEFSRRVRIAAGAVQLLRRWNVPKLNQPINWFQFLSHKVLRWLSPLLFILLFALNLLLLPEGAIYKFLLGAQLLLIALITVMHFVPRLRRTRFGAVFYYFGFSQIAMLLGLAKGLRNRQIPQWEKAQRLEVDRIS